MSQHVPNEGGDENTSPEISKPLLRLKLLDSLRQADFPKLQQLFTSHDFEPLDHPDVQQVVQLTLHYAVQVAPFPLIKAIVSNWTVSSTAASSEQLVKLDINKQDSDGNTPLHLAALQSRADVVQLLMDHGQIDDCIINNSRLQPVEMCKNLNIAQMMQVNRANYVAEIAHEFRLAFNNRDFSHLESILSNSRNAELLDINGNDPETGDTVLHEFVKKRDVIMCRWIIDHGGDPFKRDKRGRLPINSLGKSPADKDSTSSENTRSAVDNEIKQLLEKAAREQSVINVTNNLHEPPSYKGYLRKWTNFAQGYKLRWFILGPDGTLSYYKDQDDSTNACRGSLNVSTCYLHLDSSEKLKFEIIGGSNGTVRWHLKGNHPIETNKWVWAIQSAIRTAKDREMVRTPPHPNNYDQQQPSVSSINSSKLRVTPPGGLQNLGTIQATTEMKSKSKNDHFKNVAAQTNVARSNSGSSISSSDVELNDNLTDSGRQYVTKVKINKQQHSRLSDTSCTSQTHLDQSRVQKTMKQKVVMQEDFISTSDAVYAPANEEEEEEEDGEEIESLSHCDQHSPYAVGEDEEDLKVNYGPYAQELAMLQRSILIEISTLNELLDDGKEIGPVINTAKKSLTTISKNFMQLNRLTEKRDKHLVKMLAKQRDINNLWINSVKELEMELLQKTEKLASMDNDRRSLKKLLQKKLNEVTISTGNTEDSGHATRPNLERTRDSSRQFAEIVEFIQSNESSDEEDSDIDEFFDAEDMDKNSPPYDGHDVISLTKNPDTEDLESNLFHMEDESKQGIATGTTTSQKPFDSQFLEGTPSSLGNEVADLTQNIKPTINAMKVRQEFTSSIVADTILETSKENKDIYQNGSTDEHYATSEDQKTKQRMIYEEGTFLGYDDGLRKKLALTRDDRPKINLWSVLKSMIGKDMTRMSLPVAFNEPTSLLQRVAEDLEYSDVLDTASSFEDSTLRLLHIAAFLSSSYSSTTKRVAKPFNPLLGETFEYARPDKKYRFFTEQVSHHPPISATWTESPKWDFFGESYVDSKFYGRSFDIKHLGLWYLRMRPDNGDPEELYTWKKPDNSVIGILIGKPEIDNHGDVHIVNHTTGDYCLLHFKARGWRSANAYEVRGEVFDSKGVKCWVLGGHWNDAIYAKCVLKHNASEELTLDRVKNNHRRAGLCAGPNYDGHKFMLWHVNDRPVSPFNLTSFAISLNALQPRLVPWLAPTDSRHRPDQRAMEEGRYDDATEEKRRVEEKQRTTRREREAASVVYQPRWFKKVTHPITGQEYWEFNGEYWKMRRDRKLNQLENIF